MVATRRGKTSHFGTCPGANEGCVLTHFLGEFPRRFGEVQVVIRGNMNHCYNNL